MYPARIWTLYSVREIGTLFSFGCGTFLRGVFSSAATYLAALLLIVYTNPSLAIETASAFGTQLSLTLLHALRRASPTLTGTLPTIYSPRLILSLYPLPVAPPPGLPSYGGLYALLVRQFTLWWDDPHASWPSRLKAIINLMVHWRPTLRGDIPTLVSLQLLIGLSIFVIIRLYMKTGSCWKLFGDRDWHIAVQEIRDDHQIDLYDQLEIQYTMTCVQAQAHAAAEKALRKQTERNEVS